LPSGTNYEVFSEHGIPGSDNDLFLGGYTYHTKLDNLDDYENGTLQAIGENVVGFLNEIMNSPAELKASREDASAERVVKTTYFDIMGVIFVTYDRSIAQILAATETCVFLVVGAAATLFFVKR